MIRAFFNRIIEKRHFWRQATFGEIADLYVAQTMRTAAISLVSGFSSVFMYRQGYSVVFIMGFWASYFTAKIIILPLAGYILSKAGTAVSMMVSNDMYIPAITALSLLPEIGNIGIVIYGVCMAFSATLHELCYYVDFSRIKTDFKCYKSTTF
jgi:hypothetical protein